MINGLEEEGGGVDKIINKQAEHKHTHRYREHFDGCQMGGELGG